jgi:NadR type nicotinamide-nucleotide adenylyltransferase
MQKPERILILGPESTGKSTLAADLAAHFREPWVPEFAREYLEKLNRAYDFEDLSVIAKGQIELEDELAQNAKKFLFVDTDLRVIKVWSEHKFDIVHDWILEEIERRTYSKILITDVDLPWEADPLREHPELGMRMYFLDKYLDLASKSGFPFQLISGERTIRLETSINFILG